MKTEKQIQAEIKALEACKSYAPARTIFGDDNHRKIDLQIETLKGQIDIDESAEEWDSDYTTDEQSAILEARDWVEGQIKESPSSGWDHCKPKGKKKAKAK